MSARSNGIDAQVDPTYSFVAADPRIARAVTGTLVIAVWMALGFAFALRADAYLLAGIPITIGFQILVVRRPLRTLWVRAAPLLTFTPRWAVVVLVVAVAPAAILAGAIRDGDLVLVGYGLAGIVGAVGAVYCLRAMEPGAVRSTIRATLITSAMLVIIMAAYRIASGGSSSTASRPWPEPRIPRVLLS